jgi:proline iminopeptidase
MRNRSIQFLKYALLATLSIYIFLIFYPKTYNVPQFTKRADTQYWLLETGSKIGYVMLPAKGAKKPYPIVFLQGGPGGFIGQRTVDMLAPLTENGYDVYLYDQLGSGSSERLEYIEGYTTERQKQDLEAIVKTIGAEKVILLGQSWGALLAVLYVADNPQKVDRIIFTGPGPIPPMRRELASIQAPDSLHLKSPMYTNAQANETTASVRSKAMLFFAITFGKKLTSDKEADDFQTLLNNKLNKSTVCDTANALPAQGGGGFYVQVMTVKSFADMQDPRPKLKDSNIPILVLKGQCDNQKWGFTQEYLELFPKHKLVVVPDAGHSISIEQPARYLAEIRRFLE